MASAETVYHSVPIMICDIVSFSTMTENAQANAVRWLWKKVNGIRSKYAALANGTGDGAIIAFPQRGKPVSHKKILELAEELIAHMRGAMPSIHIRIGVHVGRFRKIKTSDPAMQQLVGTGLNEVSRIGNIGDAGQVVVSQNFIRDWKEIEDVSSVGFHPPLDKDSITVFVKHDKPMGIRLFVNDPNIGYMPERLRRLFRIDAYLKQTLEDIRLAVIEILLTILSDVAASSSEQLNRGRNRLHSDFAPRVSIFVPRWTDNNTRALAPTEYRRQGERLLEAQGKTYYEIKPKIEGPAAHAFIGDTFKIFGDCLASCLACV